MNTQLRVVLVALLFLLAACTEVGQEDARQETQQRELGTVSGYVSLRKAGQPVEGTTVSVVGKNITTQTDEDGFYSLLAPEGVRILEFRQDGYATSRVEGLRVEAGEETFYDTIQLEIFDPFLPTEPPELNTSVHNGDSFTGSGEEDTFTFLVDGELAEPEVNGFTFTSAALGQSRGNSGYLNQFVPGVSFDFNGSETEVSLSAAGFEGDTTLHIVTYDLNQNRTEVIRYVEVFSGASNLAELTDLTGQAITFNDVAVFGALGVDSGEGAQGRVAFTTAEFMEAVRANDTEALGRMAQSFTRGELGTQDFLDEYIIWVDLFFSYDFTAGADLPTAFQIYRQLEGEDDFRLIGQVSPAQADLDPDDLQSTAFGYRDATPALQPGLDATYRVVAVRGENEVQTDTFSVTPLEAFFVDADSPENGATGVPLLPEFEITFRERSNLVYYGALVLDRVHADDNFQEWLAAFLVDNSGITSASIPHNFNGTATTETLQPFHTYDWQPIAITTNGELTDDGVVDETAISVAADFFDLFGVGFGVEDGPVNTFTTGDGSDDDSDDDADRAESN